MGRTDRFERGRGDAGQAGVALALLVAVVAMVMTLMVATVGRTVVDRTRARTAADAAALAGVTGGRAAAEELAGANGGTLEDFSTVGTAVEARVRVGTARATSWAAPGPPGPSATGSPPAW